MDEKELLKQLSSLKSIVPSREWKTGNREILVNQIYNSRQDDKAENFSWARMIAEIPVQYARNFSHTAAVSLLAVIFVLTTGICGLYAAKDSKPGDSLYIAKIVSERAQFALAFDENKKNQLGLEFAANRAKEISQVLSEDTDDKSEKVEKLVDNFKREINSVRIRIAKNSSETAVETDQKSDNPQAAQNTSEENTEEDSAVFSANSGREEKGIKVSGTEKEAANTGGAQNAPEDDIGNINSETETESGTSTEKTDANKITDPEKIILEAGELLNENDNTETLNKLDEAIKAIDSVNIGIVKGISEQAATSTGDSVSTDSNEAASSTNIENK